MGFLTGKKFLLLGFLAVILAAVPLTIMFLEQPTTTESSAAKSTQLFFTNAQNQAVAPLTTFSTKAGETFTIAIGMNPGTNEVIATTLHITYDATKLEPTGNKMDVDSYLSKDATAQGFTGKIEIPKYTTGSITTVLSTGINPAKSIKTPMKIATVTFTALSNGTAKVAFGSLTSVTSIADPEVNVLSNDTPIDITIDGGAGTTPTVAPTASPSATTGQIPVCTALNVDRTPSGTAPFSITFTGIGNDPDGTITKATFNFGDGPQIDEAAGTGQKSVSIQKSHTYQNAGTYKAHVVFTDNTNGISVISTCTQTVTVVGGTSGAAGSGTGGASAGGTTGTGSAAVPIEKAPANPAQPGVAVNPTAPAGVEDPGPTQVVLGAGVAATVMTVIGGILFFSL